MLHAFYVCLVKYIFVGLYLMVNCMSQYNNSQENLNAFKRVETFYGVSLFLATIVFCCVKLVRILFFFNSIQCKQTGQFITWISYFKLFFIIWGLQANKERKKTRQTINFVPFFDIYFDIVLKMVTHTHNQMRTNHSL